MTEIRDEHLNGSTSGESLLSSSNDTDTTTRPVEVGETKKVPRKLAKTHGTLSAKNSDAVVPSEVNESGIGSERLALISSLSGGDRPYQRLVLSMTEGAMITTPDGKVVFLNPHMAFTLGIQLESLVGKSAMSVVAESSHAIFQQMLHLDAISQEPFDVTLLSDDGSEIAASATCSRLDVDEETVVCFIFSQATSHKKSVKRLDGIEQWFHTLAESSNDVIAIIDENARLKYANPALEYVLGISPEEQVDLHVFDLVHPDDMSDARSIFAHHKSSGGVHAASTFRVRSHDGEWRCLEITITNCLEDPVIRGFVVNARDVTERDNLTRALLTFSKGNQVLTHANSELELLENMCKTFVEVGGYSLVWVGYARDDEDKSLSVAASAGVSEYLEGIRVTWDESEYGQGPVGMAIRTGIAQIIDDMSSSESFNAWKENAAKFGLAANCSLPLKIDGKAVGALAIYANEYGVFDVETVNLLQELADDLAYGVARIRDSNSLKESEERFRTLSSVAPIGILEVSSGLVRFANEQAVEIYGTDIESILGQPWVDAPRANDISTTPLPANRLMFSKEPITMSYKILRPDGEHRHVRMSAVFTTPGNEGQYIATIEDVTGEVQTQEALLHQAFHDSLTGLSNRSLFIDRLEQELGRCRRDGPNIAILFLDLDRLKIVNDGLGHEAGDALLVEVGRRFLATIRAGETVSRFSGDEFLFIIRDIGNYEQAVSAAKRILETLENPVEYQGNELVVTGSIGIVIPDVNSVPKTVLRDADTAMYKAKLAGGNRYELFDEELHLRLVTRLGLEGELRRAIERKEFELFYQPKVDPITARPIGAEALIRWNHPTRGRVAPIDFIEVAEECGLIKPIGNWVFEEGVKQLCAWDGLEDGPRLEVLSVNVSATQLEDASFSQVARRVIENAPNVVGRFAIEITESTLMVSGPSTKRSLMALENLGVLIGIDDFGTGYSSLSSLHILPVSVIKVDSSFIERLGGADDSVPIVKAIVDMGHALGLMVVAEGVNDVLLGEKIVSMNFDLAQGYLWAEPMPASEFVQWWAEQSHRVALKSPL